MSTQRIKLADGKYCYSGPGCKWHSPNGIAGVRRELRLAEEQLHSATTLDEFTAAKERHIAASEAYDSTSEGLNDLERNIQRETSRTEKARLTARLEAAKARAEEIEKAQEAAWVSSSEEADLVLNDKHTYDVPTYKEVNPGMYSAIVGNKYTGYKSASEITKLLRQDIKEAQAKGYLPKNLTYSITKESYSGGQSITIEARGLKDTQIYEEKNDADDYRFSHAEKPEIKELKNRLSTIADAYNSRSMHGEIDYFNVAYYSHVKIEDEQAAGWRKKESDRLKMRKSVLENRKSLTTDIKQAGGKDNFVASSNIDFAHKTKDGVEFGAIPGTNYVVFKHHNSLDPSKPRLRIFDFNGVGYTADSLESAISQLGSGSITSKFKKNLIEA